MKKIYLFSILFIVSCASTPKQASADMEDINISQVVQTEFNSTHGCFTIYNAHALNEFFIASCLRVRNKDLFKLAFSYGLYSKRTIDKFDNAIFIDVFNEFKKSYSYLHSCSPTDLIRREKIEVQLLYACQD